MGVPAPRTALPIQPIQTAAGLAGLPEKQPIRPGTFATGRRRVTGSSGGSIDSPPLSTTEPHRLWMAHERFYDVWKFWGGAAEGAALFHRVHTRVFPVVPKPLMIRESKA